jgi:hypothetical protein
MGASRNGPLRNRRSHLSRLQIYHIPRAKSRLFPTLSPSSRPAVLLVAPPGGTGGPPALPRTKRGPGSGLPGLGRECDEAIVVASLTYIGTRRVPLRPIPENRQPCLPNHRRTHRQHRPLPPGPVRIEATPKPGATHSPECRVDESRPERRVAGFNRLWPRSLVPRRGLRRPGMSRSRARGRRGCTGSWPSCPP